MVIRALIVEDEPLARQTLRDFAGEVDWLEVVGEAADGLTAVRLIDKLRPDLVLLDVQMPELSGLEVLSRVKHEPSVVFTTAYDAYAVTAFELEALDYLLKPFGRGRFQAAMERVRRQLEKANEQDDEAATVSQRATRALQNNVPLTRLFVRHKDHVLPVNTNDISRFVAEDDYVRVYANNSSYLIHLTLSELETRLDGTRFCRAHRSVIVNLDFVERVEPHDRRLLLHLRDGSEVLASRAGSQALRELIF